MNKIALVTPLKDESENIEKLIKSIESQSMPIFAWIILENDSTDGSQEILDRYKQVQNVDNFEVIHLEMQDKTYQLGHKYASIIQSGFRILSNKKYWNEIDYLGILDSDIFAESNYYEKLIKSFDIDAELGITSGRIVDENGKADMSNLNWVRGGCRLWRMACYLEAGYIVGPSADTLSVAKARIKQWKVFVTDDAVVVSRAVGARANYGYYGRSTYFRGHTLMFALLRSVYLFVKGYPKPSIQYINAYVKQYVKNAERTNDKEILDYYKHYLQRKIFNKL